MPKQTISKHNVVQAGARMKTERFNDSLNQLQFFGIKR